jgi:hypothetical protein
MHHRAVTLKWIDVSEVRIYSIIRAMMDAVRTSETSVYLNVTARRCIPEDSKFLLAAVRTCNLTRQLVSYTRQENCSILPITLH